MNGSSSFRVGLIQMRSGRTPASNLDAAVKMIGEAKVYCDVCDEIRPALLHEYRPAGLLSGGLVRCAVCYASRARLYGTKVSGEPSSSPR